METPKIIAIIVLSIIWIGILLINAILTRKDKSYSSTSVKGYKI